MIIVKDLDPIALIKSIGYQETPDGCYIREYKNVFVKIKPVSSGYDIFIQSCFSDIDYWVFLGYFNQEKMFSLHEIIPDKQR